ncbi:ATP-grasp domain-containing protein, partial [Olleya sp. AH-315-F22]|nr:ATP-grasp domain-containing protein [Olleya sp. AH-315-F22]
MSNNLNILIPDGDSTWALSVIYCLSHYSNIKIYVLSSKKKTPAKFSKYISYYKYYKQIQDDNIRLQILNSEIKKHHINIVMPIAENEIGFVIKHLDGFDKSCEIIPLPSKESFKIAINKKNLNDFLAKHKIPSPKSIFINSTNQLDQVINGIVFPVLIKPLDEKGGDGIVRLDKKNELEDYVHNSLNENGIFIQQYIVGYDIDCSVICLNGEVLTYTIQKGNLKGHNLYAPQLGVEFLNNYEVYNTVKRLMKLLNWSGVAHIDLIYDNTELDFKVLEINARFWGSIEASRVVGVNFPFLLTELVICKTFSFQDYKYDKFVRFKGLLKLILRNPL